MSRVMNRAAGTDYVPGADYAPEEEKWWEEDTGVYRPVRAARPKLTVLTNENFGSPDGKPGQTRAAQAALRANAARRKNRRMEAAMSKALMYLTVALLAVALFVQIGRLSAIAAQNKQISVLTSEIKSLESEKANLEVRLSMQQNINRVRDEAIYRLGMTRPEDGQIRVVSLNGYSVSTRTQTADNSVLEAGE